ncbi:MAG: M23 family metallopeptidase [Bacteroidota bacterium]|nr:M23 family metallopeptidase [Bacteroidota bacterium]
MPSERNHHASKKNAFEIVVIPQGDTGSTSSFKASVLTIALVCIGIVMVVATLTVASIIYTPVSLLLPMSEEQLQKRFGSELFEMQKSLNKISNEVIVLREYNNKLRKALGQKEIPSDSNFMIISATTPSWVEDQDRAIAETQDKYESVKEKPAEHTIVYRNVNSIKEEVTFRAEFPIIVPAVGYVSRRFESERGHYGIDYAGKIGSLIIAATDGYVVFAGFTSEDGYTIMLSHGGGFLTTYKHNQSLLKSVGEFVKRGEPIALLGNSGRTSFGPHLHFEVWNNGKAQNPNDYLIASEL